MSSQSGIDSGYGSQPSTCSSSSSSNSTKPVRQLTRILKSGKSLCENLSEFDLPVSDAIICRFRNIQSQLEQPLLEYVQKTPGKYPAMAIRLMVLGVSAEQAKPHIVALVAQKQCKRVQKFFNKPSVQALIRPSDVTLPSFEILIYGRAPELKQANDDDINVLTPLNYGNHGFMSETFCGAPIIIRHPSGVEKRATFGGIIKIVDKHKDFRLYGLIAGHVVGESSKNRPTQPINDTISGGNDFILSESESDSEVDDDDDSDSDSRTSMDEIYQPPNEIGRYPENIATENMPEKVLRVHDAWSSAELGNLGIISRDSPQICGNFGKQRADVSTNLDWALIDMSKYAPNRLSPRSHGENKTTQFTTMGDLVMPLPGSTYPERKQSVFIISGSEGLKKGTISILPSRILLSPGKVFVDALVVNLDEGKEIVDGDSGSWVVNEITLEVYGHIVAADSLGGGYIMPFEDTLRDITEYMQVNSVEIASLADIASSMMKTTGVQANNEDDDPTSSRSITVNLPRSILNPSVFQTNMKRDHEQKNFSHTAPAAKKRMLTLDGSDKTTSGGKVGLDKYRWQCPECPQSNNSWNYDSYCTLCFRPRPAGASYFIV